MTPTTPTEPDMSAEMTAVEILKAAGVDVSTDFVYPPIPDRSMDWCCLDRNTYDGAPDAGPQIVGWGRTEAEAIADFFEQWEETSPDRQQGGVCG